MSNAENEVDAATLSPNTADYQKSLQSALSTCPEAKVLAFKTKAPAPPEGHMNNLRVLYSQNRAQAVPRKAMRSIPSTADRILDAPDLRDDYYVNLIDWHSTENLLAVALGPAVYVWNAESSGITKLCELPGEDSYVSSVSWMNDGEVLAVGCDDATVQIWDANNLKRLRTMRGHQVSGASCSLSRCPFPSFFGAYASAILLFALTHLRSHLLFFARLVPWVGRSLCALHLLAFRLC